MQPNEIVIEEARKDANLSEIQFNGVKVKLKHQKSASKVSIIFCPAKVDARIKARS